MEDLNCYPFNKTFREWQILLANNEQGYVDVAPLLQATHTHVNHNGRSVKFLDQFALSPAIVHNVTLVYVGEYTPWSDLLSLRAELPLRALSVMTGADAVTQSMKWQFNDTATTENVLLFIYYLQADSSATRID